MPRRSDTKFTQERFTNGTQGAASVMSCSMEVHRRWAAARSLTCRPAASAM